MKKRKFLALMLLSFCFVLCGCVINFNKANVNYDTTADMTPRLISLSGEQDTSYVVESVRSAIVGIRCSTSQGYSVGSGVSIRAGGYILTNQHVINGARNITIFFADKSSTNATLIWQDSSIDLAVIRSDRDMPYLECETSSITVGQDVLAIGTPLSLAFQHTVTKGIISALNRTLEVSTLGGGTSYMQNLIQHDASINPGNSGGPLINLSGKVVGINTLKATDAEGIGFAIPIITGESIVERLSTNNAYSAPYMGVFGVSTDYARYKNIQVAKDGLYVMDIDKQGIACLSGIMQGDVIYKINETKISDFLDLRKFLYSHSIGDEVKVYLYRNGEPMEINMVLCEK